MKRFSFLLLSIVFLLNACTTKTPESTIIQPALTPTVKISPTSTKDPFPDPVLKIVGEEEVVFDWSSDRCEYENIPDLAARAFRDASDQVHLLISHFVNYQMIGTDLDNVTPNCYPIMYSDHDADPSMYNDVEWIASPYTEDGKTIYALVHNEYQGHAHPGQCPQNEYFPCWDNSITMAISTDGGKTYSDAFPSPAHLIARLPFPYESGAGPEGTRNPSNIIKGKDGFYYAFLNVSMYKTQEQWVCLIRTNNLSDPASWRFWDGEGFDGQFVDPYLSPPVDPEIHVCPALEWENIGASLNDSITFNTYLNRYVLIGLSADQIDGREVWGIYYSFSFDLIHWTRRKLLAEMPLPWTVTNPGSDISVLYPTLIDPNSDSRNFETTGKTAYLYFTRHNFGQGNLDRDLIRVLVEFFPSP